MFDLLTSKKRKSGKRKKKAKKSKRSRTLQSRVNRYENQVRKLELKNTLRDRERKAKERLAQLRSGVVPRPKVRTVTKVVQAKTK